MGPDLFCLTVSPKRLPHHFTLTDEAVRGYNTNAKMNPPLRSAEDKEAVLNKKLNENLANFDKPFITIWGNHKDPMWIGKDSILQKHISGAKNQIHYTLESNHFIQEDKPEELTQILIDFFKNNNTEASL